MSARFSRSASSASSLSSAADENEKSKLTNPIINVNGSDSKKKPYDVKFSKYQPKIDPNTKYSSKQAYRRYKTRVEPNLNKKIMIDEEDDIVKKIKKALGIEPENTNYTEVESMPFESTYAEFPENQLFNKTVPNSDDEAFLLSMITMFNLTKQERLQLEKEVDALTGDAPTATQIKNLVKKTLDKIFKTRGNEYGRFQMEDLAKINEITKIDFSKANSIYETLTNDEKKNMGIEAADREEYPDNFTGAVRKALVRRFANEKMISDTSKAEEESLLGQKMDDEPVAARLKSRNLQIQPPEPQLKNPFPTPPRRDITPKAKASPSPSEISQESTVGGEITSQNIVMGSARRGRPATRPETVARQVVDDLIHNLELEEFLKAKK